MGGIVKGKFATTKNERFRVRFREEISSPTGNWVSWDKDYGLFSKVIRLAPLLYYRLHPRPAPEQQLDELLGVEGKLDLLVGLLWFSRHRRHGLVVQPSAHVRPRRPRHDQPPQNGHVASPRG